MNRSLDIAFHAWRGIGPDVEPDLFFWRWRLGFMSLAICRVCVLAAYQDIKAEAARLGAEATRLRETIATAVDIAEKKRSEMRNH